MTSSRNGDPGRDFARRLRHDPRPEGHGPVRLFSGRRFVIAAALVMAVTWGGLYLIFRDWRAHHRELAAYGREQVAAAIDPLADLRPPGVEPEEWRTAVALTRKMLEDVTASGLMDRPGLDALRADLEGRVAGSRARPERALGVLAGIWEDMGRKTKLSDKLIRPKLLERPRRR